MSVDEWVAVLQELSAAGRGGDTVYSLDHVGRYGKAVLDIDHNDDISIEAEQ
jgi:hypothetical protein